MRGFGLGRHDFWSRKMKSSPRKFQTRSKVRRIWPNNFEEVSRRTRHSDSRKLGPVQTSCFCRAELISGIKFDKSTAEARRLNQTFELSSASATVLHGSGTAAIETSCFCRAKTRFINYINVFWRDCVPTGSWEKNCYKASLNPEFGSTLARRLNQSCFPAVLQSNQITIKFGTAEARRLNWALGW